MATHNAENERIKRRYFRYLREAERYSEASVDAVAKALSRFESYTKYREFKIFHVEQAIAFKNHLRIQKNRRTGGILSKSTVHATLTALRNFFHWLAGQPGFRSHLSYSDANYFNLPEKESRVARAQFLARAPTVEQISRALRAMPAGSVIERRDRAIIAFSLLTGARDGALASFRLKHVDLDAGCVNQDAREVRTKNSKTFTTWFFPVPAEFLHFVGSWVRELRVELLWGNDDPLFPATQIGLGNDGLFRAVGIARKFWSNADPIRKVFRSAFDRVGLPYFNPHSFRRTLALLGERLCRTPEEMKAWSQNLGHDHVQTTFSSYGQVPPHRQAEIISKLASMPKADAKVGAILNQLVQAVRDQPAEPEL